MRRMHVLRRIYFRTAIQEFFNMFPHSAVATSKDQNSRP